MIEKGLSENGYTLAPCPLPGTIRMRWTTDQPKSELAVGPADPGTIMMRWTTDQPKSALAVGPADPACIMNLLQIYSHFLHRPLVFFMKI